MQVAFIEWTVHGKLRHPRLLGVRRQAARDVAGCRDHASREGAVSGRRHHQGRAGGVLRSDRAGDAAAPQRPPGDDGALSRAASARRASGRRTCRRDFPTWLERVEVPKKDGVVHHPLVTDMRVAAVGGQPEHASRSTCGRRARPTLKHPDVCVFDLDPSGRRSGAAARGRARRCAICSRSSGCHSWIKTSGSKGFHIVVPLDGKTPMGQVARFAHGVGTRCSCSRDPQQLTQEFNKARSRAAASRRHRAQRLQRDVRRGVRGARRSAARRCRRRARGRKSSAARSRPRIVHAAQHAGARRRRSATSGPTCASGNGRCASRSSACDGCSSPRDNHGPVIPATILSSGRRHHDDPRGGRKARLLPREPGSPQGPRCSKTFPADRSSSRCLPSFPAAALVVGSIAGALH